MEGDPRVDRLMYPVELAIKRREPWTCANCGEEWEG